MAIGAAAASLAVTRVRVLSAGYAAFGAAFAILVASAWVGALLPYALLVGLAAAVLLLFSDDDLPKWAGIVLVAYFGLIVAAFLLATPITVRTGGSYGIEPPHPRLAEQVGYYLGALSPLMMAGTALAAAWERETPARLLLVGAVGGFVIVGVLTFALRPGGTDLVEVQRAASQADLLSLLFAVSALSGAVGAGWSAARPQEFG
jgi:hypothetical protein